MGLFENSNIEILYQYTIFNSEILLLEIFIFLFFGDLKLMKPVLLIFNILVVQSKLISVFKIFLYISY